jgi:adenine deaminase
MNSVELEGWFADFGSREFYQGQLRVVDGRIGSVEETGQLRIGWNDRHLIDRLILPGLVDAHVHIESSMLMPSRFAAQAVRFGTVATVSDPHEIANVLGLDGIRLMLSDAEHACIRIHFTAPSCVPATSLETSGATLGADELEPLFAANEVVALGEMMNYPGVVYGDPEVMKKIAMAQRYGRSVDGHAPGLTGSSLETYAAAGIATDHECSTIEEAREKIALGMKILIREGSSARNFDALAPLIDEFPDLVMLCTDDFHPDDLLQGHIDRLIRQGLGKGLDFFNLYRAASLNPSSHFGLRSGTLCPGDPADFVVVETDPFKVCATWINGAEVFREGAAFPELYEVVPQNVFRAKPVTAGELEVRGESGDYRVIGATDGELLTEALIKRMGSRNGLVYSNISDDILKLAVINRYAQSPPAIAWITGFGLQQGALASSIAHDSHNIIAVGTSDEELAAAINAVIAGNGGIAVTGADGTTALSLPVAGLMSTMPAREVGEKYAELSRLAGTLGSPMKAPFMTLSFMALLVIPHLKLSDLGLFDCDTFRLTTLKVN